MFILYGKEDFPGRRVSLGHQCTGKKGLGMFWGEEKKIKNANYCDFRVVTLCHPFQYHAVFERNASPF